MENVYVGKKPRVLCLHGHNQSAQIMKEELKAWPEFVLNQMDLVCINAPFLVDEADLRYVWYEANKDFTQYTNFDEAIAYIEENMVKLGPFDGVLGFSQGAHIAGALPGMQREGVALTKAPKIKFVILISGSKLGGTTISAPDLAKNAFSSPITIPSLHILDSKTEKPSALQLAAAYVEPLVILHDQGHCVPHLDEKNLKIMLRFLVIIQKLEDEEI